MTKICTECYSEKPLEEFYRHKKSSLGFMSKCKECIKSKVRKRYNNHESRIRIAEYEKLRTQNASRKEKVLMYQRNRRAKYPDKAKARNAVSNAIRDKRLFREPCKYCGDPKSQAHHHDYSKPLDVTWCCFKCHREIEHKQTTTETIAMSLSALS